MSAAEFSYCAHLQRPLEDLFAARHCTTAKHTALEATGFPFDKTGLIAVTVNVQRLLRRDHCFVKAISWAVLLIGSAKSCLVRSSHVDDVFEFRLVDPTG